MTTRALLLIALLPLTGCKLPLQSGGPDGVVLAADQAEYREGDTAFIVLRNDGDRDLGYNLCQSARLHRTPDGWVRMVPLRMCTDDLQRLRPGAETYLEEPITAEWQPGEYRMVTMVEVLRTGARHEIFTAPFVVREPSP
jgi:hypothetical protein